MYIFAGGIIGNDNVYDHGNRLLHKLATSESCEYETIKKLLHVLDDDDRKIALSVKNRRGETAFDVTGSWKSVETLLQWSSKQDGFYYLSNPPAVLLAYSTIQRDGFENEVYAFVKAMEKGLDIMPMKLENPTVDQLMDAIREAQSQPNISALIVVYMSHGSGGYVETRDQPVSIQQILLQMCSPLLKNKPKVGPPL